MKTVLTIAVLLALGASPVLAKTTYCQDPTTHKRIACKATPAKPVKATPAKATPAKTATAKTTTAAGKTTAHTGKKCGASYIAQNQVCHKS